MGQARQRGTFEERKQQAISKKTLVTWPLRVGKSTLANIFALIARRRMRRLRPEQHEGNYQFHQEQVKLFNKLNNTRAIKDDAIKT